MSEAEFDPAVLASMTCGVLLTEFTALHAAAEFIIGRVLHRTELPSVASSLKRAVLSRYPEMPQIVGQSDWEVARDAVRARYGTAVKIAGSWAKTLKD